jgi:predicted nucleic acid-binding protein
MPASAFIDTNVFVYQLDNSDIRKQKIADDLIRNALVTGSGCISYQVVQECLNVALRKAEKTLDPASAGRYLDVVLEPLLTVSASVRLYREGINIQTRYRYSFYDSMIVAAALSAGCTTLYSEDMQHGQRIDALTIVDPFQA